MSDEIREYELFHVDDEAIDAVMEMTETEAITRNKVLRDNGEPYRWIHNLNELGYSQ